MNVHSYWFAGGHCYILIYDAQVAFLFCFFKAVISRFSLTFIFLKEWAPVTLVVTCNYQTAWVRITLRSYSCSKLNNFSLCPTIHLTIWRRAILISNAKLHNWRECFYFILCLWWNLKFKWASTFVFVFHNNKWPALLFYF